MNSDYSLQNSYVRFPKLLSGTAIKGIAILTMLIDHIGAVVLAKAFSHVEDTSALLLWYNVLRNIGRLAFPLFCFMAVEGFQNTRNRKKYLIRLFVFAMISEPAFDIAFSGSFLDFTQQNVMFTIMIGIIGIWLFEFLFRRISETSRNHMLTYTLSVLPLLALSYWAGLLNTDYSTVGVLIIGIMYIHREHRIFAFLAGTSALALGFGTRQLYSSFAVIPILFYSGKKGMGLKYFFYIFYPAHLLILAYIAARLPDFLPGISG